MSIKRNRNLQNAIADKIFHKLEGVHLNNSERIAIEKLIVKAGQIVTDKFLGAKTDANIEELKGELAANQHGIPVWQDKAMTEHLARLDLTPQAKAAILANHEYIAGEVTKHAIIEVIEEFAEGFAVFGKAFAAGLLA